MLLSRAHQLISDAVAPLHSTLLFVCAGKVSIGAEHPQQCSMRVTARLLGQITALQRHWQSLVGCCSCVYCKYTEPVQGATRLHELGCCRSVHPTVASTVRKSLFHNARIIRVGWQIRLQHQLVYSMHSGLCLSLFWF